MKRMSLAIAAAVLTVGLAGCGQSDPEPTDPATPTEQAPTDSTDSGITAENLPGTWEAPEAEWVVHFNADGTFVEDFAGNEGMRSGEWTLEGNTVTLIGGDGNDDPGTISGETIEFQLGTLERAS